MTCILVTGATGFVGRAVVPRLQEAGHVVRAVVRPGAAAAPPAAAETVMVDDIGQDTDWSAALDGVDAVVHLAARVHVMRETASDPDAAFRRVNTLGTRHLAEAAAEAGVRRFVFLSTVKVGGEATLPGARLDESGSPAPQDAYARSKAAAEQALAEVAGSGALRWIALRPPLVYGPGVGGNFRRLLRLCDAGAPLPLGAVDNARSLIGVRNLADAVRAALETDALDNGPYYVSDDEDVSTPELVRRLARALGRPARLVPVPPVLLLSAARLLGRGNVADRLLGSLCVDPGLFRRGVGWTPPVGMIKGLQETADWHREAAWNMD